MIVTALLEDVGPVNLVRELHACVPACDLTDSELATRFRGAGGRRKDRRQTERNDDACGRDPNPFMAALAS